MDLIDVLLQERLVAEQLLNVGVVHTRQTSQILNEFLKLEALVLRLFVDCVVDCVYFSVLFRVQVLDSLVIRAF